MDAIRLREAAKRDYRDPALFLMGLRCIERRLLVEPVDAGG